MSHKLTGRGHPLGVPGRLVGPTGTHSLMPATHLFLLPLEKNQTCSQARVLAHFVVIFDLLAWNSISKTVLRNYSLVCDSSNGPISFCSSALYFANFCCCGDHVYELAC